MSHPEAASDLPIPLSIEEVAVEKRQFITTDVRVHVETIAREVLVSELLTNERIEVVHIPVERFVDAAPPTRQEGDVTIISVVEEVIERRIFLKEEIHLRRVRTTRAHEETVVLREEKVTVERIDRAAPEGPDTVQTQSADQPKP